jgi:hypothetical protein
MGTGSATNEFVKLALAELEQERRRQLIDAEKERLRSLRPWWRRIFPFRIKLTIERR